MSNEILNERAVRFLSTFFAKILEEQKKVVTLHSQMR